MDRVGRPEISTAAMSGDSTGRIVAPKRGHGSSKKSSRITAYAPRLQAQKGSVGLAPISTLSCAAEAANDDQPRPEGHFTRGRRYLRALLRPTAPAANRLKTFG